jgi:hypothetical protein
MRIVGFRLILAISFSSCIVYPCVNGFLVTNRNGRIVQRLLPSTWFCLGKGDILKRLVTASSSRENNETEEAPWYHNLDVLQDENGDDSWYGDDTVEDWVPDAERAKKRRRPTQLTPANEVLGDGRQCDETNSKTQKQDQDPLSSRLSPYTDEEEALIEALGGKRMKPSKREEGFIGDATLREISTDYSVPICYLADVLCMWNVPVPINIHDRLGDLVTGEQAFALVEAIHSLDIGALHDRYSNQSMLQVCNEWNIELKDAFQFAVAEGWSLPFGVRTHLRVEQEDELLRVYSPLYQDRDGEYDE